jgi:hypothetical protein
MEKLPFNKEKLPFKKTVLLENLKIIELEDGGYYIKLINKNVKIMLSRSPALPGELELIPVFRKATRFLDPLE